LNKIILIFFLFLTTVFYAQDIVKDTIVEVLPDEMTLEPKKFDPNFKDKYKDEAFEYEPKIRSISWWEQFKSWLNNKLKSFFKLGKNGEEVVGFLIKLGAFLVILLVIYFIIRAIVNKETTWIFGKSSTSIITDENIETLIHEANFDQLIQEKLSAKDYRNAIRFYYLYLLKKMSDSKIIDWEINKTNADYAYEIKEERQKLKFEKLSYLYEYIWYGEFEVSEEKYLQTINQFKEAIKTI
jgi:hypothetical protein